MTAAEKPPLLLSVGIRIIADKSASNLNVRLCMEVALVCSSVLSRRQNLQVSNGVPTQFGGVYRQLDARGCRYHIRHVEHVFIVSFIQHYSISSSDHTDKARGSGRPMDPLIIDQATDCSAR